MIRTRTFYSLSLTALLWMGLGSDLLTRHAVAADSSDQRARIVESSLKDLSTANDTAIQRQRIEPNRALDALGNPRVALQPPQPAATDSATRADVESSLHRLRRETVSRQTEDGRKARVDEHLERAAQEQR